MTSGWGFGQRNKKLSDLATIIDEKQLSGDSGNVPLDALNSDSNRTETFRQEVSTAIQEIKDIANALVATGDKQNTDMARRLMASRSSLKLLARTFFN